MYELIILFSITIFLTSLWFIVSGILRIIKTRDEEEK